MIDVEVSAIAGTASDENLAKHHIAGRISLAQKVEWFCTFRIKKFKSRGENGIGRLLCCKGSLC